MALKRLVAVLVLGYLATACTRGEPTLIEKGGGALPPLQSASSVRADTLLASAGNIESVVVTSSAERSIAYGLDAARRVQFRIEGTDGDLAPLLAAFEDSGHRVAYGGLCEPGPPDPNIAGPVPCPDGPKGGHHPE